MKIRPLPGIDLARIATLEPAFQRPALELLNLIPPPFSYKAIRRSTLDIMNVQPGPLVPAAVTEWHIIEAAIRRIARSDKEFAANIQVAQALYDFARKHDVRGRQQEFYPLAVGMTAKVEYWSPAVVSLHQRPTVVFLDPRKSSTLNAEARRFVFSVMHERIRQADPAYANIELAIVQFDNPRTGPRHVITHFADGVPLLRFGELDTMVRRTYAIWGDVLSDRSAKSRRADDFGPLFGAA